jgi:hypothetical protein
MLSGADALEISDIKRLRGAGRLGRDNALHTRLRSNSPWTAYALQGDTAKARAAYQDFLTLKKDADRDIPILKEAKAEYVKLR